MHPLNHEIQQACQQFIWSTTGKRFHGAMGTHRGHESGSSVEFKDFRDYIPGDDLRHIDWAAYGRNDRLTIRLYQQEVSPWLDILVDQSHSMAIDDGRKGDLTKAISGFMQSQSIFSGSTRLYLAGRQLQQVESIDQQTFNADLSLLLVQPADCASQCRIGGVRCILSDFLSTHDPRNIVLQLASQAAQLIIIQILGPWESNPEIGQMMTLIDSENGQTCQVAITAKVRQHYLQRLQQIQQHIREACYQVGAIYIPVVADADLDLSQCLRRDFAPYELVTVR